MFKLLVVLMLALALTQARPKQSKGSGHDSAMGSGHDSGKGSGHDSAMGSGHDSGKGSGHDSGSSSHSMMQKEPLTADDFHGELSNVQNTALEMAEALKKVREMAESALAHPEGEGWEEFGEAMEETFQVVGDRFGEEMERTFGLAEAIWHNFHTLKHEDKCGSVAALDAEKETVENLEFKWAVAMIEDLGCMEQLFAGAEQMRLDKVNENMDEDEAIEMVQSVVWNMHKIKRAGEIFGNAMESIGKYFGFDDESSEDKDSEDNKDSEDKDSEDKDSDENDSGDVTMTSPSPPMEDPKNSERSIERLMRLLKKFQRK